MNLCIAVRHAESVYNTTGLVNGDPTVPVPLSDRGLHEARALAAQLRHVDVEVGVHTGLERTAVTARLAIDRPAVPMVCEPLLDDIRCGIFEGGAVAADHAWRGARPRNVRPPGGESIADAARRIGLGLRRVAQREEGVVLLVTHELAMRYLLNGAAGSDDIALPRRTVPNAVPFLVSGDAFERATERIQLTVAGDWSTALPGETGNGG